MSIAALALPVGAQAPDAAASGASVRCCPALVEVDYESGTLDSGIDDLTTTHAPAADASSVVAGGAHGSSYAVAHRVTLGDPGYFSDGAYRSESATDLHVASRFRPGDEKRYELSLQLPDSWQEWSAGESENGEIVFQAKPANANKPSWLLMTKRNELAFRSPVQDIQQTVVPDYRPYLGEWIDIRVDVQWADDASGSYRVSTRLPGQADFAPVVELTGLSTWNPENPADFGYVKWGLYRAATSLEDGDVATRVVYHDDVRIADLPDAG